MAGRINIGVNFITSDAQKQIQQLGQQVVSSLTGYGLGQGSALVDRVSGVSSMAKNLFEDSVGIFKGIMPSMTKEQQESRAWEMAREATAQQYQRWGEAGIFLNDAQGMGLSQGYYQRFLRGFRARDTFESMSPWIDPRPDRGRPDDGLTSGSPDTEPLPALNNILQRASARRMAKEISNKSAKAINDAFDRAKSVFPGSTWR